MILTGETPQHTFYPNYRMITMIFGKVASETRATACNSPHSQDFHALLVRSESTDRGSYLLARFPSQTAEWTSIKCAVTGQKSNIVTNMHIIKTHNGYFKHLWIWRTCNICPAWAV